MRRMMRLIDESAIRRYSSRKSVDRMRSFKAVVSGRNLSTTSTHFDICISSGLNGDAEMTDWQGWPL